jgi:hypothetical protein
MLGSLNGRDVVGREKGILLVPVRQGTGLGSPARGSAGTGLAARCGGAGNAVPEELLIFAPPVLPEQRFTRILPRAAARHNPVLSMGCGRGKHAILAATGAAHIYKSYLNQITQAVNFGARYARSTARLPVGFGYEPARTPACSRPYTALRTLTGSDMHASAPPPIAERDRLADGNRALAA